MATAKKAPAKETAKKTATKETAAKSKTAKSDLPVQKEAPTTKPKATKAIPLPFHADASERGTSMMPNGQEVKTAEVGMLLGALRLEVKHKRVGNQSAVKTVQGLLKSKKEGDDLIAELTKFMKK